MLYLLRLSFIRIQCCFSYVQCINWAFVGGKLSSFGNGWCTGLSFSKGVFFQLVYNKLSSEDFKSGFVTTICLVFSTRNGKLNT